MPLSETVLKVYSAYRSGNVKQSAVVKLIDALLASNKVKDIKDIYSLSRLVYAHGTERDKFILSRVLTSHNLKELVPYHYKLRLLHEPEF